MYLRDVKVGIAQLMIQKRKKTNTDILMAESVEWKNIIDNGHEQPSVDLTDSLKGKQQHHGLTAGLNSALDSVLQEHEIKGLHRG